MSTSPPKLPPLPQENPIAGQGGLLTLPWNLFFVELLRYIQANTNGIASLALTAGQGGGGVAAAGAAPAVPLSAYPSGEGTSNLGARGDHIHQRAIGIENSLIDLSPASMLNFDFGLDAEVVQLVSAWKMEASSGTRINELSYPVLSDVQSHMHGSYTGPNTGGLADLYEIHGTVDGEAGHIGNAFRPVIDPGDGDYRNYGQWLRSPAYVNWYPLGPDVQYRQAVLDEGTNGYAVSGTIAILFKPETGIIATGGQSVGGLSSFNSVPYKILSIETVTSGGVLYSRAVTTNPAGTQFQTPNVATTLDAWHVGIAWYDKQTGTLGYQLDDGAPVTVCIGGNFSIWYGNFTHWMTGPRFKGLIDTSVLWRGVLTPSDRAAVVDDLFTTATDLDYQNNHNIRASVWINPFALETFGG